MTPLIHPQSLNSSDYTLINHGFSYDPSPLPKKMATDRSAALVHWL